MNYNRMTAAEAASLIQNGEASTGDSCDGTLTRAHAIKFRAPYTTNTDFRKAVNNGEINYTDIHLSQVAQRLRSGFLGHVTTAIVEACELTDDGRIYLTAGVGLTPTIARLTASSSS